MERFQEIFDITKKILNVYKGLYFAEMIDKKDSEQHKKDAMSILSLRMQEKECYQRIESTGALNEYCTSILSQYGPNDTQFIYPMEDEILIAIRILNNINTNLIYTVSGVILNQTGSMGKYYKEMVLQVLKEKKILMDANPDMNNILRKDLISFKYFLTFTNDDVETKMALSNFKEPNIVERENSIEDIQEEIYRNQLYTNYSSLLTKIFGNTSDEYQPYNMLNATISTLWLKSALTLMNQEIYSDFKKSYYNEEKIEQYYDRNPFKTYTVSDGLVDNCFERVDQMYNSKSK